MKSFVLLSILFVFLLIPIQDSFSELEISTKEMYLFGITKTKLNSSTLYKQLTQQETIPLTQEILCTMLLNIVENGCDDSEVATTCEEVAKSGENISYDDFLHLLDWDSEHSYTIPIGERLIGNGKIIPYVVNPYNCISIDNFIKESGTWGMHLYRTIGRIDSNVVLNNGFGGIHLKGESNYISSDTLTYNIITGTGYNSGNNSSYSYQGSGIYNTGYSRPVINNNHLFDNYFILRGDVQTFVHYIPRFFSECC